MFTYQKTSRYFAQAGHGLEDLVANELASLGAREIKPTFRGVYFDADKAALYRINYCSRLTSRILAPLLRFDCHSTKYLYQTALKINWHKLLTPDNTFAIFATVAHSKIKHSRYAALCLKDAIADYFREKDGKRPSVDTKTPDISFHLRIERNKAIISLDTSGGSLHKRGYRQEAVEAPMQETLAAAMIRFSEWDGRRPLVDPMCGSGTLLAEALMQSCRIPAAFLRKEFGFEMMDDFDESLWHRVKKEADNAIRELPPELIAGSDISGRDVSASGKNLALLPQGGKINLKTLPYQERDDLQNKLIITNPPYGIRLEKGRDMAVFMKEFGDFLKQKCTGSTAILYFGKKELIKSIGLKPSWKKPLANGGLDGVLTRYDMY
ncbi:MAG: class I SAM-dependent RNA methyltransferase [Thermodesulfobacteriota bacterium]|nr:class I SAM-dependent RNA methyltransferase [Thermodesulfobacteriota bacterium]